MRFAVIGAGGWGTAMSRLLSTGGHDTTLWARDPELAETIARDQRNIKYLPDVKLPIERLHVTADLAEVVEHEVLVLAVPSFGMADLLRQVARLEPPSPIVINLAKGIDCASKRTMSELIGHVIPQANVFTLSGPVSQITDERMEPLFITTALAVREPMSIPATITCLPLFPYYPLRQQRHRLRQQSEVRRAPKL